MSACGRSAEGKTRSRRTSSPSGRTSFASADKVIDYIQNEGLEVEWLLETHAHADHLSAAPYLQEKSGGTLAIGRHILTVQEVFGKIFNEGTRFARDGSLPDASLIEEVERPRAVRVKVPLRLFRDVAALVDEHLNARARPPATAARLFDGLAPESPGAAAVLQPVLELWLATTGWFMKQTHQGTREPLVSDVQALPEYFARFEATLFSLTREYFRGEEALDAILRDANA